MQVRVLEKTLKSPLAAYQCSPTVLSRSGLARLRQGFRPLEGLRDCGLPGMGERRPSCPELLFEAVQFLDVPPQPIVATILEQSARHDVGVLLRRVCAAPEPPTATLDRGLLACD